MSQTHTRDLMEEVKCYSRFYLVLRTSEVE